jgi:hypothetical protein
MNVRLLLGPFIAVAVAACGVAPTLQPTLTPSSTPTSTFALASLTPSAPTASETLVPALTVDHPTVTITPPNHLKDGQTVEVRVTGFGVGGKVWLSECASASVATDLGCGAQLAAQPFLVTDDTRAGSASLVVRAEASGKPVSAKSISPCADRCVVVATLGDGYDYAVAPIAFGPP